MGLTRTEPDNGRLENSSGIPRIVPEPDNLTSIFMNDWPRIARKIAQFGKITFSCQARRLVGGGTSLVRTGLTQKIPANREIYREFYRFAAPSGAAAAITASVSMT